MKYPAILSLLLIGVVSCHSDRPLHPRFSADLSDANHGTNTNQFFFWLPPIVNQSAPASQVFSQQLSPLVLITDEGPATSPLAVCNVPGTVIRTFSGPDVTVSDAAYHVNWHTSEDNLNPDCSYRITVKTAGTVLGFADVDVVSGGNQLKNVTTDQGIPLLDDRTLPIKFFIGVGSQCTAGVSDCGEGTARPGQNTTIVTTSGRAGIFVPNGAVTEETTISIQSVDNFDVQCIPTLLQQFPGTAGGSDNSCYDYHKDKPGKFASLVTIGICPDTRAFALDHPTLDLLQLFQLDVVNAQQVITALNNAPAPFLKCDPNFSPSFGSRRSVFGDLANGLARLIGPRPLYASSRTTMFDLGAGGSTDGFSRFTWALPVAGLINFDLAPDGITQILSGTVVNSAYSHLGVSFTRTSAIGACPGTDVYANADNGPLGLAQPQNNVSVCPQGSPSAFSEATAGAIEAQFTVPVAQVCIDATPILPAVPVPGVLEGAYLQAFDVNGAALSRLAATVSQVTQTICVQHTNGANQGDIAVVQFAGAATMPAIFDNLSFSRIATSP